MWNMLNCFGFSAFRAERTLIWWNGLFAKTPKKLFMLLESLFFLFIYYFYEAAKILKLVIIFFFCSIQSFIWTNQKKKRTKQALRYKIIRFWYLLWYNLTIHQFITIIHMSKYEINHSFNIFSFIGFSFELIFVIFFEFQIFLKIHISVWLFLLLFFFRIFSVSSHAGSCSYHLVGNFFLL